MISAAVQVYHRAVVGDAVHAADEHIHSPMNPFWFQAADRVLIRFPVIIDRVPLFPYRRHDPEVFPQSYGAAILTVSPALI